MRAVGRRTLAGHGHAFTLVEVLVVISIIGLLIALLLPAVQSARATARSMECRNHLRQLGIAASNHEALHKHFPSLGKYAPINGISWSVHANLLPFLEQETVCKLIDFSQNYDAQPQVTQQRIATFLCPEEMHDEGYQETATRLMYPSSYGFCYGTWFLFDPNTSQGGDGAIAVNHTLKARDVSDGLSNTLYAADVKAWTPYCRDASGPDALNTPPPASVAEVLAYCTGGSLKANPNLGHTEWVDARALHTGFTTVFTPNTRVLLGNNDIDFISSREGRSATRRTFAAITARSYHSGHVNALLLDGSVHTIADTIDRTVWRALGTRNGQEVISSQ